MQHASSLDVESRSFHAEEFADELALPDFQPGRLRVSDKQQIPPVDFEDISVGETLASNAREKELVAEHRSARGFLGDTSTVRFVQTRLGESYTMSQESPDHIDHSQFDPQSMTWPQGYLLTSL